MSIVLIAENVTVRINHQPKNKRADRSGRFTFWQYFDTLLSENKNRGNVMYRVSKVLNNNGVIAINMEENIEYVLLGKGIGFGKKISQRFECWITCTSVFFERRYGNGGAQKNWQKVFLRNIWRSHMKFCKKQR